MLLALYIVGYVLTFSIFLLGAIAAGERNYLKSALKIGFWSWFGVAAFLVAMAESIDDINEVKK